MSTYQSYLTGLVGANICDNLGDPLLPIPPEVKGNRGPLAGREWQTEYWNFTTFEGDCLYLGSDEGRMLNRVPECGSRVIKYDWSNFIAQEAGEIPMVCWSGVATKPLE